MCSVLHYFVNIFCICLFIYERSYIYSWRFFYVFYRLKMAKNLLLKLYRIFYNLPNKKNMFSTQRKKIFIYKRSRHLFLQKAWFISNTHHQTYLNYYFKTTTELWSPRCPPKAGFAAGFRILDIKNDHFELSIQKKTIN